MMCMFGGEMMDLWWEILWRRAASLSSVRMVSMEGEGQERRKTVRAT